MSNNERPTKDPLDDENWPRTYSDLPAYLQPSDAGAVEEDIGIWDDEELTPQQRAKYRDMLEEPYPWE